MILPVPNDQCSTEIAQPERREPASFRRQLEAVKEASCIEQVALDYGAFTVVGDSRLLGRCVSPSHEDKTPSMHIYTETQTFKCFGIGCGAQGDVLDLVMLVENCELWEAMMLLATRHGIEMPERPQSWFARQERQSPVREALKRAKIERVQRRLYRWLCAPAVARFEDETERRDEEGIAWEECGRIARMMVCSAHGEGA
jgi:DNA primase